MLIDLAYGRAGLTVDLSEELTTVIEPASHPGLPDQRGALLSAIRNPIGTRPLRQLVPRDATVAVSVCDITRPMPSATVLPAVLGELTHVPTEQIVVLIGTGSHRANTPAEIERMLGKEVAQNYRVCVHNAFDKGNLTYVGDSRQGIPIWLNRRWVDSDVRITTGFVEPHFFAGFSGGPKMVAPALAGIDTIMELHNATMIADRNSTWGITEGNPVHGAIRQIAEQTGVDFGVDVTINRERKLTSVYAGDLFAVHRAACDVSRRAAMRPIERPFDIVVTTNSGYPLDLNLYQAVKGMSAAAQVVRRGGAIICVAECSDGIPEHGEYGKILSAAGSPTELLDTICAPGYSRHDQWQVQIQAQIQLRAEVYLKSRFLEPHQVRAAQLTPIEDVEATVSELVARHGGSARIGVLPQGPQTIPYLEPRA